MVEIIQDKVKDYITKQTKGIMYTLNGKFVNELFDYIANHKVFNKALSELLSRAKGWNTGMMENDEKALAQHAGSMLRLTNTELEKVGIRITPDLTGKIAFQTLKEYIDVKHSEYKGTEGIYDYEYDLSQTVKVDKLPEIDFQSKAVNDEFKSWDYQGLLEMPPDEFGKWLHYYGSLVSYLNNIKWQMEANVTRLTLRGEEIIPGAVNGVRNWYEKNRPSVKKSDTHLLNRVKSANRDYLENQEELHQLEAQFTAVKGLAKTYEHVFNTMSRVLAVRLYKKEISFLDYSDDELVEKIPQE